MRCHASTDRLLPEPGCLGIEPTITGQLTTGEAFPGIDHQAAQPPSPGYRITRVPGKVGFSLHLKIVNRLSSLFHKTIKTATITLSQAATAATAAMVTDMGRPIAAGRGGTFPYYTRTCRPWEWGLFIQNCVGLVQPDFLQQPIPRYQYFHSLQIFVG